MLVGVTKRLDSQTIKRTVITGRGRMPGFQLGDRELTGLIAFLSDPAAANATAVKHEPKSRRKPDRQSPQTNRAGALLERLRIHGSKDRPGAPRAAVVDDDGVRFEQRHDRLGRAAR